MKGTTQTSKYNAEIEIEDDAIKVELTLHYFLHEPDYIDWDKSKHSEAENEVIGKYTYEKVQEIFESNEANPQQSDN
ncbi:hypothetical protein [Sphingobacterium mizutaii]|uniref:hypothetical protein n=1 Tax=Sphingobacterium mizutaii TaxID=1010 RepID=UPI0028A1833B|nr:hypothetical protein [Sphingobacterium mizutaii]